MSQMPHWYYVLSNHKKCLQTKVNWNVFSEILHNLVGGIFSLFSLQRLEITENTFKKTEYQRFVGSTSFFSFLILNLQHEFDDLVTFFLE